MMFRSLARELSMVSWPMGVHVSTVWSTLSLASLLALTGCAGAYTPPELTTAHPAHPEAMAVPEQAPSMTLAYGPADRPSPRPAYAMAQSGPQEARPSEATGQHTVVGEGKVIAVVPSSNQIVVDHKEITGFMDAMTMGYRVEPSALLQGVKPGDEIRFTIDTQKKAIVKIDAHNEHTFVGEGTVVAVVPNTQQIVIDHGDIKGFMDAMTMGFKVVSSTLLEGVKAGDRVRFSIGAEHKAITKIEKLQP